MRTIAVVWAVALLLDASSGQARADEVLDRLRALPRVEAAETTQPGDVAQGLRRFALAIEQPTDHAAPAGETFRQKLVLFHRGFNEPMVLQTSGYAIFTEGVGRMAAMFETNQLQVEHRFFAGSRPASLDWTKLTVRQSAEDFHRVVATFKALYAGRWVGTGRSKGGMTSTYHRRFHPDDLDGTVAEVAPLSFTTEDPRYVGFLEQVGGDRYAACRSALEAFQRAALGRRDELLPLVQGSFGILGDKDTALEHATIELPFYFWQYGDPEDASEGCRAIPGPGAEAARLFAFLKGVNDIASYTDPQLAKFQPYYYQAASELGAPANPMGAVRDLLTRPFSLDQYLPAPARHDVAAMADIRDWAATRARSVMWVYGELDPWTAGAYRDINAAQGADNHWFVVPGGNHGVNFAKLPPASRDQAVAVIGRWLGKAPAPAGAGAKSASRTYLEDEEFRFMAHRNKP